MGQTTGSSTWTGISETPLPPQEAIEWATDSNCGAVVSFRGTVRDFSEERPGVTPLEYEAYGDYAVKRLEETVEAAQSRWNEIHRVVLLHRVGTLEVKEVAVVVAVAAPPRGEAFEAARFCIETLKETVPIWKRKTWAGGRDWGVGPHPLVDPPNDFGRAERVVPE